MIIRGLGVGVGQPIGIRFERNNIKNVITSVMSWIKEIFRTYLNVLKCSEKEPLEKVFQAQRIEDQRNFAIKAFTKNKDAQDQEAIINEITIMRQLLH